MNKFGQTPLLVAAVLGIGFLLIGTTQFVSNPRESGQDQTEEATPVQEGVVTARQREHGKLFKGYGVGKKITEILREKEEVSLVKGLPLKGSYPGAPRLTLNSFVQEATCGSDGVVIGTVTGKSSQLTADGDFVFTDYTINVETILKSNEGTGIQENSEVIVARAGGKIKLNGHFVTAVDKSAPPLLKGTTYLLFLKKISSTGGYTTPKEASIVSSTDGKLRAVIDEHSSSVLDDVDAVGVTEIVKAYASSGVCAGNQ